MTIIYNISGQTERRRYLRKRMTEAEKILWKKIRNRRIGNKFKRQFGVGKYIIDFYCPELKLAIELDGGDHYEEKNIKRDLLRTEYLKKFGIKVKRYTNLEVKNNLESVILDLAEECKRIKEPHPPPAMLRMAKRAGSPLLIKERGKEKYESRTKTVNFVFKI